MRNAQSLEFLAGPSFAFVTDAVEDPPAYAVRVKSIKVEITRHSQTQYELVAMNGVTTECITTAPVIVCWPCSYPRNP